MKRISLLSALFLISSALACNQSSPGIDPAELTQVWRLANRGVAHTERFEFPEAVQAWKDVLAIAPEWGVARINLGIATLNLNTPETELEATEHFRGIVAEDPENPWANYCLAILLKRQVQFEQAEQHLRAVLSVDPEDPDSLYELGDALCELDRLEEGRDVLRQCVELEPNQQSAWYRLASTLAELGDAEGQKQALERFQALQDNGRGIERKIVYGRMGFYANVIREFEIPRPVRTGTARAVSFADGSAAAGLSALEHGEEQPLDLAPWMNGRAANPAGLSGGATSADFDQDGDFDLALANFGDGPGAFLLLNEGATYRDASAELGLVQGPARTIALAAADFDGDTLPELVLGRAGPDRVLARELDDFTSPFSRSIEGVSDSSEVTFAAAIGDVDQDGDLDLCLGRERGLALFRWNGTAFEDVTADSGVERGRPAMSLVLADVDGDADLDVAVGSPEPHVWVNDRTWGFTRAGLPNAGERPFTSVALGDVNGDQLMDWLLASAGSPTRLLLADREAGFVPDQGFAAVGERSLALGATFFDADRDGDLDCLTVGAKYGLYLNDGANGWRDGAPGSGLAELANPSARGHVAIDHGNDGDVDFCIVRNGQSPQLLENLTQADPDWIGILPRGIAAGGGGRGRSLGIGSRVEVETPGKRSAAYSGLGGGFGSTATPLVVFDLDDEERCSVRIVWADSVVQNEIDLAGGRVHEIEQEEKEQSSCPLVFFWNGKNYEYLTDCLGVGGVGFLVEPGVYGPPDPDEVVLIGERLVPQDGRYAVLLAEPMEEVVYLDRASLIRVEHPEGTLVYPDERFALGGEPASGRPLLVRADERAFPLRATSRAGGPLDRRTHSAVDPNVAQDARDDRAALLEVDRNFAGPFALHRRLVGYAAPWSTELAFAAPDELAPGERVYLFLNGWVEYPYSRLNYAAWQGDLRLESWTLSVPAGASSGDAHRGDATDWREVLPEFGYPAGKPRTMALEVTPWLADMRVGDELRLRLSSNLSVYVDQAFLARDLSAAALAAGEMRVSEIAPVQAELAFVGFPREYSPDGQKPLLFDHANRDRFTNFKALAGNYTEYGDALELVLGLDDRFAIYARGDELALSFAAADFPAQEAARATFLVRLHGYCKDMCPHTASPNTVEPLPFAAMGNYPPEEPLGANHPSHGETRNVRREPPRAIVR